MANGGTPSTHRQALASLGSIAALEENEVRLDPADCLALEEDVEGRAPVKLTTPVRGLAVADRDHGVSLLDKAIDDQRRRADEGIVLDLPIERILAREMPVSGEIPDGSIGQAGENPLVIAPPAALEIGLDDRFAY